MTSFPVLISLGLRRGGQAPEVPYAMGLSYTELGILSIPLCRGILQFPSQKDSNRLPEGPGQVARCIYESLALKYRVALEQISRLTGRRFAALHILGGGANSGLLCQMTADCLGILVYDPTTPCVCTIHSGWKGTVQKITDKTVSHLIQKQLLYPQTTQVYFGPSLQFDSLEIGQDVIAQIQAIDMDTAPFLKRISDDKALFDNQGLNIQMLKDLKIPMENIHPSSYDTLKDTQDTFSYRMNNRLKEFPKCGEHFIYGYIQKNASAKTS